MPYLRVFLFLLTVLPLALVGASLLGAARPRRDLAVAALLAGLAVFLLFAFRHHQNRYEFLDPACYRSLAAAYAAGEPLMPDRPEMGTIPADLRKDFLLRPNLPSLDGVFRYLDPPRALAAEPGDPDAFRTVPCFLPMLPASASALGPAFDAFPPLVAALWFLALICFALASEGADFRAFGLSGCSRLLLAIAAFLATFFPSWFLRGFHADAVGGALVSTAFLAVLARPFPGQYLLAGLCLGASLGYHPTMVLYVLPVALYAIVHESRWRPILMLVAGALPGAAFAVFQLAAGINPYFQNIALDSLADAIRTEPTIRLLLKLVVALAVASAFLLALSRHPGVRRRFEGSRVSRAVAWAFAIGTLLVPVLLHLAPRLGLPEALTGLQSVHPRLRLVWFLLAALSVVPFFRRAQDFRAERMAVFLVVLAGAYGVYLKGSEIPVDVWSYRRLCPFVALMVPLCLKGALTGCAKRPAATLALSLVALLPMAFAPGLWFGVSDAGADRLSAGIRAAMSDFDLVLFDNRERTAAFTAGSGRPILGLPRRRGAALWNRCSDWVLGRAAAGSRVALATSHEPCSLELGFALEPVHASEGVVRQRKTKRLLPSRVQDEPVRDVLLALRPVPEDGAAQRKVFDGGPFGIRGPWKRANRGGYWSRPGCAIVGPTPRLGAPVDVLLDLGWYDRSGTNPVSRIRITPPGGAPAQTIDVSSRKQIERLTFAAAPDAAPDAPATGLWTIEGSAVFRSAELGHCLP